MKHSLCICWAGLKVYTILKYQKLVLTVGAIRELEQRYGDMPLELETTMVPGDDAAATMEEHAG